MTDGSRIKPRPSFSDLVDRATQTVRADAAAADEAVKPDQFVVTREPPTADVPAQDAWSAVEASSHEFWRNDAAQNGEVRRIVAADLVQALQGIEGVIATGESAALLEDHRRLRHGFEIIYGGALPDEIKQFLQELQRRVVKLTGDFIAKLEDDLLQSRESISQILDEDARSFATIIFNSLSTRAPIDRAVVDHAIQSLRATLSQGDYRTEHTQELDVLAKRLEWLQAAVVLRSPVPESR